MNANGNPGTETFPLSPEESRSSSCFMEHGWRRIASSVLLLETGAETRASAAHDSLAGCCGGRRSLQWTCESMKLKMVTLDGGRAWDAWAHITWWPLVWSAFVPDLHPLTLVVFLPWTHVWQALMSSEDTAAVPCLWFFFLLRAASIVTPESGANCQSPGLTPNPWEILANIGELELVNWSWRYYLDSRYDLIHLGVGT